MLASSCLTQEGSMHVSHFKYVYRTALAVVMLSVSQLAFAGSNQYSGVATRSNLSVWRVNHQNGSVSLCSFERYADQPDCYPWSANESIGKFDIIRGHDVLSTWRINVMSGEVSLCEYDEITAPPICTPWSKSQ